MKAAIPTLAGPAEDAGWPARSVPSFLAGWLMRLPFFGILAMLWWVAELT